MTRAGSARASLLSQTQALLHAQSAQALAAIRDAVGAAAAGFQDHGTVQIPMPAVLASAEKPGK